MKYFLKYLKWPTASEWEDFRQYAYLMLTALVPSFFALGIFYELFSKEIHFTAIENQLTKIITFTVLGLIYSGVAVRAIVKADTGYDEILDAVREVSQEKFNKAYHKRISRWHHLFLGTISSFMIGLAMMVDYDSFLTGAIIVIPTTYIMTLAMLFAVSLDHAKESPLYAKKIDDIFVKNYEKYKEQKKKELEDLKMAA